MAGRDKPENNDARGAEPTHVPPSGPPPGSGYTSNPYENPQHTQEFGTQQNPGQPQAYPPPPNPTAQYTNQAGYPYQEYPPTGQFPTGQTPTDQFAAQQPGQWSKPPAGPPTSTPPYGMPLAPQGPGGEPPPPPPRQRGRMWPWVVAALAIFLLVVGGAVVFYLSSLGEDSEAAPRPTRTVAPVTATTAPPTTSFTPKFVAISGTVESNDGSTLVIKPEDGGASVTVITDADTQVLLGGDGGVSSFKPGDGVFVQGGEQEDGRVLAKMIIGSLFGE